VVAVAHGAVPETSGPSPRCRAALILAELAIAADGGIELRIVGPSSRPWTACPAVSTAALAEASGAVEPRSGWSSSARATARRGLSHCLRTLTVSWDGSTSHDITKAFAMASTVPGGKGVRHDGAQAGMRRHQLGGAEQP